MTKKEKLLFSYRVSIGLIDMNDYVNKLPIQIVDEMCALIKLRKEAGISDEVKEMALKTFEIAIDVTEKEKGQDYTKDDVLKTFVQLMLMTDPKNLISPISIRNIENN